MSRIVPIVAGLAALAVTPRPPGCLSTGPVLYQTHCAVCHGADGRGDGPWADIFAFRPADLTRIAARSRGPFPIARVRAIIDGRKQVQGRFPAGMPVWGDAFRNAEDGYLEQDVRDKVAALAEYLRTTQAPR